MSMFRADYFEPAVSSAITDWWKSPEPVIGGYRCDVIYTGEKLYNSAEIDEALLTLSRLN
jgi:hypothetical protein